MARSFDPSAIPAYVKCYWKRPPNQNTKAQKPSRSFMKPSERRSPSGDGWSKCGYHLQRSTSSDRSGALQLPHIEAFLASAASSRASLRESRANAPSVNFLVETYLK